MSGVAYRPPKNVVVLALTSLFNDLSSEMVLAVFPAFFVSVLKSGAASLGLVEGLADGASNLIKIYSGRLSDRIQRRRPFIVAGYALSVATRPFYMLVGSVAGGAGLRLTDRVGKGLRDSPRDAIISLSTPPEEMGRAFGFHRAFDTIGAILGPLVAYLILRANPEGFNTVFITAFITGILAVITVSFVKEVGGDIQKKNISLGGFRGFAPPMKRYLAALLFLSVGSAPIAVLLLKTQSIGLTLASIPLFYLLYNLSYAAFSFSAGQLGDRWGAKNVVIAGYLVLVAGYALLVYAESAPLLIAAFLLLGLFPALTDGMQRALASELSTEGERGGAMGYVNAISGLGLLAAGVAGGYLWQAFGPAAAFALATLFILLGLGLLMTVGGASRLLPTR